MNKKLFVYGTLKKDFSNHDLLKTSKFLGNFVTENEYTMISLGPFPAVLENGKGPIVGEVYEVDEEAALSIDYLEGFPHLYNRKPIDTPFGEAFIYYMEDVPYDETIENVIEDGVWRGQS